MSETHTFILAQWKGRDNDGPKEAYKCYLPSPRVPIYVCVCSCFCVFLKCLWLCVWVCNDVCRVLKPGVYCCHPRPSNIIYTVSTLTHTHNTHTRARASCVCMRTSTGVYRLITFISSGHVAVGNQCCEGKRPHRQSVFSVLEQICVCVCACVCQWGGWWQT